MICRGFSILELSEIRIGNPIYPESFLKDDKNKLAETVKEQVSKLLNEQ